MRSDIILLATMNKGFSVYQDRKADGRARQLGLGASLFNKKRNIK
jgi:hypothetical protein